MPFWLVIFLFGGISAADGHVSGWGWVGVSSALAAVRLAIAILAVSTRGRNAPTVWRVSFIATHLAQASLWLLPVLFYGGAPLADWRRAASLAMAMLLAAVCLRGWRGGWFGVLAGWGAAALATAIGLWAATPLASLGFALLLVATAWAGLAPTGLPATAALTPAAMAGPGGHGSTRRGVQLAIHAANTPMIGVYDGRVFDLNKAAEAFLGVPATQCVGRPVAELLRVDPPSALDSAYPAPERHALVAPQASSGQSTILPTAGRIRFGRSTKDRAAIAVISLAAGADASGDRDLGADARRLAEWLGADSSEIWYRDEDGHLYLPKRFDAGQPLRQKGEADTFPLAPLVPEDERPYVNTLYREQLAAGQTFDEAITLVDAQGEPNSVRVVCLSRPGFGGQGSAVIGVVADHGARTRAVKTTRADLLSELPVLIWLIDASGRIVHAHRDDVRRWGLRVEPRLRPSWLSAVSLEEAAREAFALAIQNALDGKPTFDLMNFRVSRSGGRLALRSHFVPFQTPGGDAKLRRAVMVMDTIASVRELLEVERLRVSRAQYKDLVEASPNLIWACDSHFRFTFVSRRACRDVYGYTAEELIGQPIIALLDSTSDQTASRQALASLRASRTLRDLEMRHRTKDGRRIIVVMSAVSQLATDGTFLGAIGISVDVTALKQREALLAEALRVERSLLDSAGQAIAVIKSGAVARCNDAFLQLLQMRPDELAAAPVADLFAERAHWAEVADAAERASTSDGAVAREIRVRRTGPSGQPEQFLWCQLTLRAIGDGEYVIALADIDQIRRREAHAQHDARHDELTGLPNRRLLSERVRAALATSALRNSGCAMLVFDLDGFKPINDKFGHAAGDLVLREIARRLQNIVRPQDTVARLGGDEFALLMPDCGTHEDVERIAQRILREVSQPLTVTEVGGACLTASLGAVQAPEHGRDPEWLMRLADRAMYDAKMEGGDRIVFCGTRSIFGEQAVRRAS